MTARLPSCSVPVSCPVDTLLPANTPPVTTVEIGAAGSTLRNTTTDTVLS